MTHHPISTWRAGERSDEGCHRRWLVERDRALGERHERHFNGNVF
jgi:hypothetical protein